MDLLKDYIQRVWIAGASKGFWQKVEYERIPNYCSKCCKQGHNDVACKIDIGKKDGVPNPIQKCPCSNK